MVIENTGLTTENLQRLNQLIRHFDDHWSPHALAEMTTDLLSESAEFRRVAVVQMIKVDLRHQWSSHNNQTVEQYRSLLQSAGLGPEIPTDLVLAEYLARQACGKEPNAQEFLDRFPQQFQEFQKLLENDPLQRTEIRAPQASQQTDADRAAEETATLIRSSPLAMPKQFGRYEIIKQLGAARWAKCTWRVTPRWIVKWLSKHPVSVALPLTS